MRLFSDQITLLLESFQGAGSTHGNKLAKEAVAAAYRKIGTMIWSYLRRRTQVNTVAPFSSGTITYTAATRTAVLAGSTWPAWASQAMLLIGNEAYAVQRRVDGTTIILQEGRAPIDDRPALTTYKMFQIEYVLPPNFVRVEQFVQMGTVWYLRPIEGASMLDLTRLFYNPARPWQYLLKGSTPFVGRMAIEFGPPPDGVYTYDVSYYATPRQRTLQDKYSTGTVTVNGTAVVGTGTTFTSAMVGCQLRQGTTLSPPDGELGPDGSMRESTIAAVTDATHLILQEPGDSATDVKFVIDDPIDIERTSMDEAFCRMCEYEFAVLIQLNTRQQKRAEMIEALRCARAADARLSPRPDLYFPPTLEQVAYANLGGR